MSVQEHRSQLLRARIGLLRGQARRKRMEAVCRLVEAQMFERVAEQMSNEGDQLINEAFKIVEQFTIFQKHVTLNVEDMISKEGVVKPFSMNEFEVKDFEGLIHTKSDEVAQRKEHRDESSARRFQDDVPDQHLARPSPLKR